MTHFFAFLAGFGLDLLFGDPRGIPHVVVGMGKLLGVLERVLRKMFPKTDAGELFGGAVLALVLPAFSFLLSLGLLRLLNSVHPALSFATESFLCWQCLALRSLKQESMLVFTALKTGDLLGARRAVGRIVGRDTDNLDAAGVTRAAVETVAENASDGVVAPMLFLAVGGAPLGLLYKAVNTMDSMVGYKNDKYLYFGRAAARLDDFFNLIPSRLCALLMVLCAFLCGYHGKNAWRVFLRDRYNHKSPNSAQTEAACAGALGVRLGGGSYYFGKLVEKPFIGDALRPIEPEDIGLANKLLYAASFLCFFLCCLVKGLLLWL